VVLPQAVRIMMPSFVNQWVSLVKDTSLAYIVGVPEFTFLANQVNSRLMIYPAQIFVFVGIVYLLLCSALQWIAHRILLHTPSAHATMRSNEEPATPLPLGGLRE
jgi:polar amino acid transport system permease protein